MLLANLRKNSRSSILLVLFGIIIVVFIVSFGPASTGCRSGAMSGNDGFAAEVNGQKISRQDFERAYARQIQALSRQTGQDGLTREQADALGIGARVLDQLIDRQLLVQAAMDEGLRVADEEIAEEIGKVEAFQKNGAFDQAEYQLIVERQLGMMMWQFEAQIREDLLVQKMVSSLTGAAKASDDEATAEFIREKERYALSLVRFSIGAQRSTLDAPTAEDIAAYAKDNADEIKAHYESNSARYNKLKQVQARHILVKTSPEVSEAQAIEKIKSLKAKIEGGADFAEIAKAESEDPGSKEKGGDLGTFGEGTMVPEFQAAAFAMKAGEISEPVVTSFGVHLIKVEKVIEPEVITLEQATDGIAREKLIDARAKAKAKEKAEATLNALKAGTSLAAQWPDEPADKEAALGQPRVEETGDFRLLGDYIPRVGMLPALAQDLPTMKEGPAEKVYESGDQFVVLSLDKHTRPNLDELKDAETMRSYRQKVIDRRASESIELLLASLREKANIAKNETLVGPAGLDALMGM